MNTKRTSLSAIAIASALSLWGAANAQEGGGYMSRQPTPETKEFKGVPQQQPGDIRMELANALRDAASLGKKDDFQGALAKVKQADAAVTDKKPYEEYIVANFMVNFALKLNDHATATTAINRAIASNAVPEKEQQVIYSTAITLNTEAKNYKQAIAAGELLQKIGGMDAVSLTNVSIAYFNSGDYPNALKASKSALEMETAGGGKPIEQTLVVLKNAQIKSGDQKGALKTEVQLCNMSAAEPKDQCERARKAASM